MKAYMSDRSGRCCASIPSRFNPDMDCRVNYTKASDEAKHITDREGLGLAVHRGDVLTLSLDGTRGSASLAYARSCGILDAARESLAAFVGDC